VGSSPTAFSQQKLLARYLDSAGLGPFRYVSGWRRRLDEESPGWSHSWLEKDGVIIDFAPDFLKEKRETPVLITTDTSWHAEFSRDREEKPADFRIYDERTVANLEAAYRQIIANINGPRPIEPIEDD
jgi:hypothetical protein